MLVRAAPAEAPASNERPVPPPDLWLGYAATAEHYLKVGQRDVDARPLALIQGSLARNEAPFVPQALT